MKEAISKVFRKGKPRSVRKGTEPNDLKLKSKIIKEGFSQQVQIRVPAFGMQQAANKLALI